MEKRFAIVMLVLGAMACAAPQAWAQYIQNGSSVTQVNTKPGPSADVQVSMNGVSADGYLAYPKSIDVEYAGKMSGRAVRVVYRLFSDGNFSVDRDGRNLKYETAPEEKLSVQGSIVQGEGDSEETLATFSGVLYTGAPKEFKGWLVSLDSKLWKSTRPPVAPRGLYSSSGDFKFAGQTVAFFRIKPDFSIAFAPSLAPASPKATPAAATATLAAPKLAPAKAPAKK